MAKPMTVTTRSDSRKLSTEQARHGKYRPTGATSVQEDVRFRGRSGHFAGSVVSLKMTLSGHERICGAPHQARVADTSAATIAGCLRCPRAEAIHGGSSAYHSGLIPAALIMGHHLSISALCRAASASGVC